MIELSFRTQGSNPQKGGPSVIGGEDDLTTGWRYVHRTNPATEGDPLGILLTRRWPLRRGDTVQIQVGIDVSPWLAGRVEQGSIWCERRDRGADGPHDELTPSLSRVEGIIERHAVQTSATVPVVLVEEQLGVSITGGAS